MFIIYENKSYISISSIFIFVIIVSFWSWVIVAGIGSIHAGAETPCKIFIKSSGTSIFGISKFLFVFLRRSFLEPRRAQGTPPKIISLNSYLFVRSLIIWTSGAYQIQGA